MTSLPVRCVHCAWCKTNPSGWTDRSVEDRRCTRRMTNVARQTLQDESVWLDGQDCGRQRLHARSCVGLVIRLFLDTTFCDASFLSNLAAYLLSHLVMYLLQSTKISLDRIVRGGYNAHEVLDCVWCTCLTVDFVTQDESLDRVIPDDPNVPYDMHDVIVKVCACDLWMCPVTCTMSLWRCVLVTVGCFL